MGPCIVPVLYLTLIVIYNEEGCVLEIDVFSLLSSWYCSSDACITECIPPRVRHNKAQDNNASKR